MTLDLDEREVALIMQALAEVPYRISAPLIAKINQQAKDQAGGEHS